MQNLIFLPDGNLSNIYDFYSCLAEISSNKSIKKTKEAVKFINQQNAIALNSAVDEEENNALHFSCKKINKSNFSQLFNIVSALITKGININATNKQGATPLHVVCGQASYLPDRLLSLLLTQEVDVDACDSEGNTPLHCLCSNTGLSDKKDAHGAIMSLLEKSKSLNKLNRAGQTPLDLAAGNKLFWMAEDLMQKEAQISRTTVIWLNAQLSTNSTKPYQKFVASMKSYFSDHPGVIAPAPAKPIALLPYRSAFVRVLPSQLAQRTSNNSQLPTAPIAERVSSEISRTADMRFPESQAATFPPSIEPGPEVVMAQPMAIEGMDRRNTLFLRVEPAEPRWLPDAEDEQGMGGPHFPPTSIIYKSDDE
jgi:hypothetical protein